MSVHQFSVEFDSFQLITSHIPLPMATLLDNNTMHFHPHGLWLFNHESLGNNSFCLNYPCHRPLNMLMCPYPHQRVYYKVLSRQNAAINELCGLGHVT